MNSSDADCMSYVRRLFVLILAGWVALGAINFCVDPYSGLGWSRALGLGDDGSGFGRNSRFSKALVVARIQPEAVALGTSRVNHGIDPTHKGFSRGVGVTYNLAFGGAHISELSAYIKHARSIGPPLRRVVLGLDLISFGKLEQLEAFDPDILGTPGDARTVPRLWALVRAYLSSGALSDSVRKLRRQGDAPIYDLPTGRQTDRRFRERMAACGGTRQVFLAREARHIRNATGLQPSDGAFQIMSQDFGVSLNSFRELVRFAREYGIDLYLFISPTHAWDMEGLRLLGQWDAFEEWKRSLVRILGEENARSQRESPTLLWDFSGYNRVTTEPVPSIADGATQMRGYWEPSHYKKVVGDMILDRIFEYQDSSRRVPDDFGRLINELNIDQHLQAIAQAGARYRAGSRAQVADLEALVQSKGPVGLAGACEGLF